MELSTCHTGCRCGRLRGLCHRKVRRAAGGSRRAEDLRLVIMRNILSGEDHAVVAAHFEGHWRLLDNRYLVMLEDVQIRRYHPIFVIDEHEVRRFAEPRSLRRTS